MKCVHCGQRKGKRDCPALKGTICSQCCGTHRLKAISCPSDCTWLGSLAVISGSVDVELDAIDAAMHDAMTAFGDWADENDNEFAAIVADRIYANVTDLESVDDEAPLVSMLGFAAIRHGVKNRNGKKLIELFLEKRGKDMPRAQAAAIKLLAQSWASVFKMESPTLLVDLVDNQPVEIKSNATSEYYRPGATFYGWLMPLGDKHEVTLAAPILDDHLGTTLEDYRNALAHIAGANASTVPSWHRAHSGEVSHVVPRLLRALLADEDALEGNGSEMFEVILNVGGDVEAQLEKVPGMKRDPQFAHWNWYGTANTDEVNAADSDANAGEILGSLSIDGEDVTLVTSHPELARRGRDLILKHIEDATVVLDDTEDVDDLWSAQAVFEYEMRDHRKLIQLLEGSDTFTRRDPGEPFIVRGDGAAIGKLYLDEDEGQGEIVLVSKSDEDLDEAITAVEALLGEHIELIEHHGVDHKLKHAMESDPDQLVDNDDDEELDDDDDIAGGEDDEDEGR